ncbi:MAG: TetR/AcrR family transcriptional regulator [Clostridia bacterium]|nr:TetR/AcrR family transcriptional regulator [Clostridia bacterium]
MNQKVYSNAKRSQKLIVEAFLELYKTKPIEKIRVQEILDLTTLSRGTFYAHFSDVYAVREEIEDFQIRTAMSILKQYKRDEIFSKFDQILMEIYNLSNSDSPFSKVVFELCYHMSFMERFKLSFVDYLMADDGLKERYSDLEQVRCYYEFIFMGSLTLMNKWFSGETSQTYESLSSYIRAFILQGVSSLNQ